MNRGWEVDPHAALRWAQRVDGIERPTRVQLARAERAALKAMETAVSRAGRRQDKTRAFVAANGAHLIVWAGGLIKTVYAPGWLTKGCTCERCIRERSRRLRER